MAKRTTRISSMDAKAQTKVRTKLKKEFGKAGFSGNELQYHVNVHMMGRLSDLEDVIDVNEFLK